jgi:hypothetical protein
MADVKVVKLFTEVEAQEMVRAAIIKERKETFIREVFSYEWKDENDRAMLARVAAMNLDYRGITIRDLCDFKRERNTLSKADIVYFMSERYEEKDILHNCDTCDKCYKGEKSL